MKKPTDHHHQTLTCHLLLACSLAALLMGCTAVMHSTRVQSDSDIPAREGVAYFLPMGKIHILAVKTNWYETNPVPNQTLVIPWGTGTNKDAANPAYKISITQKEVYRLVVEQFVVPDPTHIYSLKLNRKPYAEDNFGITVSTNGFLTTVNATNSDRSGEIIKTLADTGIEIAKLIGSEGMARMQRLAANVDTNNPMVPAVLPEKVDITFNPLDPVQLRDANIQLKGIAKATIITKDGEGRQIEYHNANTADRAAGFYYRPALPYDFLLESAFETIQTTAYLPNKAPILTYSVKRAPFVSETNQVALQNGFLVQVTSSKPSEWLEAAKVPYYIVSAVATIPTNILQLKIDYSSASQKLLNQESNTLSAYENLIKAQTQFMEFMKTNQAPALNH